MWVMTWRDKEGESHMTFSDTLEKMVVKRNDMKSAGCQEYHIREFELEFDNKAIN